MVGKILISKKGGVGKIMISKKGGVGEINDFQKRKGVVKLSLENGTEH